MNWIINTFLKFSGIGAVWNFLDGYKTYAAAAVSILTGLLGIINELAPALAAHDAGALLVVIKHLPVDQAWLMLLLGIKALGLRHALDKQDAIAAPPVAVIPQTP